MIPYEELVIALQSWRAKQGLPVEAAVVAGSGPARTAPPSPPPAAAYQSGGFAAAPLDAAPGFDPALGYGEPVDDSLEVDEAALLEEASFDHEGGEFVAAADGLELGEAVHADDGESTSIGAMPVEPAHDEHGAASAPEPGSGRHEREDW